MNCVLRRVRRVHKIRVKNEIFLQESEVQWDLLATRLYRRQPQVATSEYDWELRVKPNSEKNSESRMHSHFNTVSDFKLSLLTLSNK
jgi:hypothetical protein